MRLIDADKLKLDCITKDGKLAISQTQIANAQSLKPDDLIQIFKDMSKRNSAK